MKRETAKTINLLIALIAVVVIVSSLTISAQAYSIREEAPGEGKAGWEYYSSLNPYNSFGTGNCTWYAFGRAYEVLGLYPSLRFTGNADGWFGKAQAAGVYQTGSVAQAGSIACWDHGRGSWDTTGHVQFVESVNSNGTITISESSYGGPYWTKQDIATPTVGVGKFQGYIYLGPSDSTPPTIQALYASLPSSTGFRLCCQASDNVGVTRVRFATWSTGDQSDLVWSDGNNNGYGTWWADISYSNYRNTSPIIAHAYAYDATGNNSLQELIVFPQTLSDSTPPTIQALYASSPSSTGFRLCCQASDSVGVTRVRFATWSTSDQSDLVWSDGSNNGYGTWWADISYSNYRNTSPIIAHAYVYDAAGNNTMRELIVYPETLPTDDLRITVDSVTSPAPGKIKVVGWAFDANDLSQALAIHVYANGNTFVGGTTANLKREDVGATFGCGDYHGFDVTFDTDLSGELEISVAAINIGAGENKWGKTKKITVEKGYWIDATLEDTTYTAHLTGATPGDHVFFAAYKDSRMVDIQCAAYQGEDLTFTPVADYDKVKIMLLDSSFRPLCPAWESP